MDNSDQLKGRAKQAVGDLTDDDEMKAEGEVDEKTGDVKEFVDDVGDKVKGVFNRD